MISSRDTVQLRVLGLHERTLSEELKRVQAKRAALETKISDGLGFRVVLRGPRLLAEVENAEAAKRKAVRP